MDTGPGRPGSEKANFQEGICWASPLSTMGILDSMSCTQGVESKDSGLAESLLCKLCT